MIELVMFIQRGWRTMIEFVQWQDWPGREPTKQHFGCRAAACQRISMPICLDSANLLCLAFKAISWKEDACRMTMSFHDAQMPRTPRNGSIRPFQLAPSGQFFLLTRLAQVKIEPRWAIELAPRGAAGSPTHPRAAPQGVEVSQQDPAKHGFSGELQPDTKLFRK